MKLHLPLCLFRAVIALMAAEPAFTQAFDVPSTYTTMFVTTSSEVTEKAGTSKDIAFLLQNNLTFSGLEAMGLAAGERIFTSANPSNLCSLTFKSGSDLHVDTNEKLTLAELYDVTFQSGFAVDITFSSDGGGAIYAQGTGSITLQDNMSVNFIDNNSYSAWSYGAAIYSDSGAISLIGNDNVSFSDNHCRSGSSSDSSAFGGAIFSKSGAISLIGNGSVSFSGNYAQGYTASYTAYSCGGAILSDSGAISLIGNGSVSFSGNYSYDASSSDSYGGAIYSNSDAISLIGNGSVSFSGNYASSIYSSGGGAIFSSVSTTITLSENGHIEFLCNRARSNKTNGVYYGGTYGAYGGAIYSGGKIHIRDNKSVIFAQNYERYGEGTSSSPYTYRLRGLYAKNDVILSSASGNYIEFHDSMHVGGTLDLNSQFTNSKGKTVAQTGDIICTGAYTAEHLGVLKQAYTDAEYQSSLTSDVVGLTTLYDGRLIIRDGAILVGAGLTVTSSVSGYSTPTVIIENATVDHAGATISFASGTCLQAIGQGVINSNSLSMGSGSSLTLLANEKNANTAVLSLNGVLTLGNSLTLNISMGDAEAGVYKLMSVDSLSNSGYWTSNRVTVNGLDGATVRFGDLYWSNNTLWLTYRGSIPELTIATWTNESGDREWNTSSINWTQDSYDYAYEDSVAVVFRDSGAGVVKLVGNLTPSSVLVDSSADYTWSGNGCVCGATAITKQGSGTLTINNANSYTGGTLIKGGKVVVGNARALGSGNVSVKGGVLEIGVSGFTNAMSFAGNSGLTISSGITYALQSAISNNGTLILTGVFNADSLAPSSTIEATRVDLNGNQGLSGFAQAAGFTLQVVSGGTVNDDDATITYNGQLISLDNSGKATLEGDIQYNQYHIASGHTASVSAIAAKASSMGSALGNISLATGGTLNADATANVNATGGTIKLTNGTLSGTLQNVNMTANGGFISGTFSGNSTLIGSNYALSSALKNNGTLTLSGSFNADTLAPSGTIAATRVDLNGNKGNSGFAQSEGFTLQVVNGGIVKDDAAIITYNGNTITLDNSGKATVEGGIQYNQYHIASGHTASVSAIAAKAIAMGSTLGNISLTAGGTLNADASASVNATGGTIKLTAGTLSGSLQNVNMTASGGSISGSFSGNSSLIGSNYALTSALVNTGNLTLSGGFNADALVPSGTIAATRVDLNGNKGNSGFAQSEGFTLQVVNGGIVKDDAAIITYNGNTITLDNTGQATVEGGIQYNQYHIASGHTASVSAIATKASAMGSTQGNISLTAGGTLNADASANVNATGGTIKMTAGTLSGSLQNVNMTASGGSISGSFSGNSTLTGSNYAFSSALKNSGTLTLSGSFNADTLAPSGTIAATRVDFNGNKGNSGFAQSEGFTLQVVSGGTVNDDAATITYNGAVITLDNTGKATVEGGIQYNQYHIASGHTASVSAIAAKASSMGSSLGNISLATGGTLNADATTNVNAVGGTINLTAGTLSGSLQNVNMTASGGSISGSFSGNSSLIGSNYALTAALVNTGNLTLSGGFNADALVPSGTIAATRVDLNGNKGNSGFAQAEGFTLQVVNDGIVNDDAAIITYNGNTITLDNSGKATVEGGIQYNQYHIASGHTASVSAIAAKSISMGSTLGNISLTARGTLNADASASVNATGGTIKLTNGTLSGALENVNMTANGGFISGTFSGNSTLTGSGYELSSALVNTGTLTLSGSFNADAMAPSGTIAATHVDLSGNKGNSGFAQSEGFTLQVVNGGTVNDDAATITYNGAVITLDNTGQATVEGGIQYNQYHIASGHTASVSAIAAKSISMGSTLGNISLTAGGTLNADASANVNATGGTIKLTNGTLSGTLQNVNMTASGGSINGTFSGNSTLTGSNYVLSSALRNNGTLTLSGSFRADALSKELTGVDVRVDVDGNEGGTSGFLRTGDFTVTISNGTVNSNNASVSYKGQVLSMTGGVGYGIGTVDYSNYMLTDENSASVSDISDAANGALKDISMTGGNLTVDDSVVLDTTGGNIIITDDSTLSGSIVDAVITTAEGKYNSMIDAVIGGGSSLTVYGGTITITGDNCYTGGTTIEGGRLEVGHANALGTGGIALNEGTLDLKSYPIGNDIFATGGTLEGGNNFGGKLTVNGDLTLGGDTTAGGGFLLQGGSISGGSIVDTDITVDGVGDMEISSDIRGNSSLILNNGDLTIRGNNNDYTGGTTINNGNLTIGGGSSLGSGDITLNGGTLNTNGQEITNNIINNGGTFINSYVLKEGNTLTVGKGGMNMVGNLTLAGGNLHFKGMPLSVDGKVESTAPVDVFVCGYSVIDMDGTVMLADFGSDTVGVTAASFNNIGYGTLSYDETYNTLSITLTNKNIWVGGKGATWIQGTNVGWADGKTFVAGNRAVFNMKVTVTITGAVEPASALVDVEKSLTFKTSYNKKLGLYSGSIVGKGCIVKRGSGKLTMNDGNTYSGGTFIEAGTVNAKGASSFGTGAITLSGGSLNLASKSATNDITLNGAASIKSGKKFLGSYTQNGGELMKGSVLNVAESSTLIDGVVNGSLSGAGTVTVDGDVELGKYGKITTNKLLVDGALSVSANGMAMNTKASCITINEGGSLISDGAIKAYSMEINGGTVDITPIKARSVTLTDSLHLNNVAMMNLNGKLSAKGSVTIEGGSKLILSGALSAKNLTLGSGDIYMTSSKLQTIKVSNELTLNGGTALNFGFSVTQADIDKNKAFKILTFKVLDTAIEASDLYTLLGLSEDICTLDFDKSRKSITLVVEDFEEWNKQAEAVRNGELATAAEEEAEDMLFAPATTAEAMAPELKKAADTLVQSTWGTVGASRAFGDTIANRGTHATLLEGGKGAAWISTMGGSSRISSEAGHAGADYTLTGAAFGIEAHLSADSTLGIAIGNSWGKVSTFSAYPVDQDSTHAGIYGNHKLGDTLSLSWMAAHTRTESDVNLVGMPCSWSQDALQLDARLTWAKALNAHTTVNAFGGLQYLATDSGECNGIKTGSLQNLRAEIGVGATHRFTGDTMAYGELSFIGDVVRNNPTAALGGLRSHGTNPGRAGMNLSVGATHRLNDDWSVNATYNLELMQNITSQGLNVGATYSF